MRSLQDTIFNWLTIKLVLERRPHDKAAEETYQLFTSILLEDHSVSNIDVIKKDDDMYVVNFMKGHEKQSYRFPTELAEMLITQIESEPEKY
ncbi:hypothetical protein [Bacillus sp. FJAT-47783]|uniref:hypothetical protein n=1 Tax=Bacillus sp. FJAT-47783 TaxID=2922712 RepID=UPI001FAB3B2B|nr:hypothetical protein [Bacillus sp. FJAT-47783]